MRHALPNRRPSVVKNTFNQCFIKYSNGFFMTFAKHGFHIQTFGCQMNAGDSDWLCRSLKARGFVEAPFAEAGVHILNTCSIREKAEQKVYSELGRIARHCKVNRITGVTVCVGGCVAQQVGAPLARRFPQVRLIFGTDGVAAAPEAISRLVEEPGLRLVLLDFAERYEERDSAWLEAAQSGRDEPVPPSAFVNIMQGCDNFCTYCIVPYVRGRQKSRSAGAVLNECRALVDGGAREITLLGQNVNSYGQDFGPGGGGFADLLRSVAATPGLERLRFVTSHPKDIAPEVIDAFAELDNLCPRLHLPLQSGSDRILKAMNRRYDTARYRNIVERLRKARPDIVLSTDIIVGFPGETEDDFAATMALMDELGFAFSFSFVYSDRPRAGAVFLPDKVERGVALERLSRLQEWQNKGNDELLASMVGTNQTILVEARSRLEALLPEGGDKPFVLQQNPVGEAWQGKTEHGVIVNVTLPSKEAARLAHGGWLGAMLPVHIEAAARHSLKGRPTGDPW